MGSIAKDANRGASDEETEMISIGHGAMGPPTSLTGGAALGSVKVSPSQTKLDSLSEKLKMKKTDDIENKNLPTNEKDPKDWETLIGERLNRFSQLLRSEIVRLKLQKIADKIKR